MKIGRFCKLAEIQVCDKWVVNVYSHFILVPKNIAIWSVAKNYKKKKSLAQKVRQKSDISDRRRVEGGDTSNCVTCVTVRLVRGHLT